MPIPSFRRHRMLRATGAIGALTASLLLGACSSVGVGVSVPIFPGVSIGIGGGSGGLHVGVGAG